MEEINTNPVQQPPPPATAPETFVVPAPTENSFVPQGVAPTEAPAAPPAPPATGQAWPRRILMIVVFLVLLLGIVAASRMVMGFLAGTKEVTITYWGLWENDTIVRPVITDFEASHPKIKVTYVKQSQRQYRERLAAAIARGEGPDVFRFHNTWVPMLKSDLAPVPASVLSPSQFTQTFYPVASKDLVVGQTIVGIPAMMDGLGLYYNEDLFAAAGVTPPATWEDLLTIVPKLTVKNGRTITTAAIALGTTGNVEHFSDIVATMMMQNGANLTQPTGKSAEETLIFYHKFADPADPAYTWNETMDNSVSAFAAGRVAMIISPSWRVFDIKQINPALRFKIAAMPQLPGNTVTWASYWVEGVNAKSKYQKQAWELVQYLTGKQGATKLYTEASKARLFGEPYARTDLAASISGDPYVGAFVRQAPNAKSFPLASRTFDNGINDKLIKYLEDAINAVSQGSAPSAALQTAASGFAQVLGSYGISSLPASTR